MWKTRYHFKILVLLWTGICNAQVDTLRIATYNLLKFPLNNGTGRVPYFRTVIKSLQPDILVVQELQTEQGLLTILNEVMNHGQPNVYQNAPFANGPDTDNGLLFRHEKINLLGTQQIRTDLRDISEYVLISRGVEFHLYSLHLKAGAEAGDQSRRLNEANALRNYLNTLPANFNFIVAGDFNIYCSSEPAFVRLTENQIDNDGQLWDPINAVGCWNNNSAFAAIHTQSTRTVLIDSGATGGLDDRFDMLLAAASLLSRGGMDFLARTYKAFGNDGRHFNQPINVGTNTAVPDSVANALHFASDHLPVYADFVVGTVSAVESSPKSPPSGFVLWQNYPNPFNAETQIAYAIPRSSRVSLKIYNIAGQTIRILFNNETFPGEYQVSWDGKDEAGKSVPAGIYFYKLEAVDFSVVKKMILLQ